MDQGEAVTFKPMKPLGRDDMRSLIARMMRVGVDWGKTAQAAEFDVLGITMDTAIDVPQESWFVAHHSAKRFYRLFVSPENEVVKMEPYDGLPPGWTRGVEQCADCSELIQVFRVLDEAGKLYEVGTRCLYCHWEKGDVASYRSELWAEA